jgi:hypothetical protein
MDLAYGFIAQTLKTNDDIIAARIEEWHRLTADPRAESGETVEDRSTFLGRLGERWRGRSARRPHGLRAAAH